KLTHKFLITCKPRRGIYRGGTFPELELYLGHPFIRIRGRHAYWLFNRDFLSSLYRNRAQFRIHRKVSAMPDNYGINSLQGCNRQHVSIKYGTYLSSFVRTDTQSGIIDRYIPAVSMQTEALYNGSMLYRPGQFPTIPGKISR